MVRAKTFLVNFGYRFADRQPIFLDSLDTFRAKRYIFEPFGAGSASSETKSRDAPSRRTLVLSRSDPVLIDLKEEHR